MQSMRGWPAACGVMAVLALAGLARAEEAAQPPLRWQWVYAPCNFQVDKAVDDLIALAARAKKAGYNGLLVSDYKFGRIEGRPANYYVNLERTRKAAADIGIDLIAGVMDVGYSNAILQNDPNLAEGIAVKDCVFAVKDGRATVADAEERLPGGGFEAMQGNRFDGWDWHDVCVTRDTDVKHAGAASARMAGFRDKESHGNARVVRKLALKPWHEYHVSLWVKTQDLAGAGEFRVNPIGADKRTLCYTNLGVKPTQDWTEHHVIFNTLENAEVNLYVGLWGGRTGTVWIDDLSLRETAGVNLLRRDGCPVRVTSEDGKTEYAEGKDYERWEYPKMGRVPWAGGYEAWHPAPPIRIPAGSAIRDDDRLKVSFYHTVVIYGDQVCGCLRHPDIFRYMEEEVRQVQKYLAPKKYFMSHDELRVAGQCGLCKKEGETAGQVLAENVRRCVALIRKVDPEAEIFVWSDMFDPNHNALDNYYLVGSTLKGSWEGLDKDVRIGAWYFEKRDQSLPFFGERGHQQIIAGYYDDAAKVRENVAAWLQAAAKVPGVDGIMYTTWQGNYKDLEAFAEGVRSAR